MPEITSQITPGPNDEPLIRRNSDGAVVRGVNIPTGAPWGGAGIADEVLLQEGYDMTALTYDADGVLTSATVVWFDGSSGVFTVTEIDADLLLPKSYTVTHALSSKTVTQPAVTRDADGNITVKPVRTVST
jgi:hypothetical protein